VTTFTPIQQTTVTNSLTAGRLPTWAPWALLGASWAVMSGFFYLLQLGSEGEFNIAAAIFLGTILFDVLIFVIAYLVEGARQARDRLVTSLVATAFIIALLPLVSLIFTVIINGFARFDVQFFSESMRNVVGEGGGALHAIMGTLIITGMATLISVPVGLLTAIYLVEYGRGALARSITFFVDVMTGIPSIVAGLFAFAFFSLIFNELREAAYALGVPKWLTIVKVVIPTAIAGVATGVTLAIARVIGETAPLLIIAGFTTSMNYNLFADRMMTLPMFVYTQYSNPGADVQVYLDRAWAGALTLILIVMALNLLARLIARIFSPKLGR
jgi:phosphate transport system permease protein